MNEAHLSRLAAELERQIVADAAAVLGKDSQPNSMKKEFFLFGVDRAIPVCKGIIYFHQSKLKHINMSK